ncbi:hypothetical protein WJX72_011192 [[Myrmecia] bisecta]|uniref:Ribosomal protein eL8/eL30/eS12/Gadd45 domain-containing protein n=1 Tax=[Myrmecia] bisecta TaxID=41462 RepID=A0AAW1Q8B6_9CHLO
MAPKKRVAAAPAAIKKAAAPAKPVNPLYEKRPKTFGVGGAPPPKKDMHRFVKWPKYVRIQRQRRVLNQRLKVPPALNRFTKTLDKNQAETLFKVLMKYRPEDKAAKKERLLKEAEARAAGKEVEKKKPVVVKFGINHITTLVENGKAQLVVIAHDVDPIELVVWLPALCKKMNVPYVIVKGKARLGLIVHKKTATALALTSVKNEDQREFAKIVETAKQSYLDGPRVQWGGGILGPKSQAKARKKEREAAREAEKRLNTIPRSDAVASSMGIPSLVPTSMADSVQAFFSVLDLDDQALVDGAKTMAVKMHHHFANKALHEVFPEAATIDQEKLADGQRARRLQAARIRQLRQEAASLDVAGVNQRLHAVFGAYSKDQPAIRGVPQPRRLTTAGWLRFMRDCCLLDNRFSFVEAEDLFTRTAASLPAPPTAQEASLDFAGFQTALGQVAATKQGPGGQQDCLALMQRWVLPCAQLSREELPIDGLLAPASRAMLRERDAALKAVFGHYAALPSLLPKQACWEGVCSGQRTLSLSSLLLMLLNFKVFPGLLPRLHAVEVLHEASLALSNSAYEELSYPAFLEVLCHVAARLARLVEGQLSSAWVNMSEVHRVKRYLEHSSLGQYATTMERSSSVSGAAEPTSSGGHGATSATAASSARSTELLCKSRRATDEQFAAIERDQKREEVEERLRKHLQRRDEERERQQMHRSHQQARDVRDPSQLTWQTCPVFQMTQPVCHTRVFASGDATADMFAYLKATAPPCYTGKRDRSGALVSGEMLQDIAGFEQRLPLLLTSWPPANEIQHWHDMSQQPAECGAAA